jgi:hypothetical protein
MTVRQERMWTVAAAIGFLSLAGVDVVRLVRTPRVLAAGGFHQVAHSGAGWAQVCRRSDGRMILRLINFSTAFRPDLEVDLIAAPDACENETVKRSERVSLGRLIAGDGDQEYEIPPDLDLSRWHAVTIWSTRYDVNFATAPLVWQVGS